MSVCFTCYMQQIFFDKPNSGLSISLPPDSGTGEWGRCSFILTESCVCLLFIIKYWKTSDVSLFIYTTPPPLPHFCLRRYPVVAGGRAGVAGTALFCNAIYKQLSRHRRFQCAPKWSKLLICRQLFLQRRNCNLINEQTDIKGCNYPDLCQMQES